MTSFAGRLFYIGRIFINIIIVLRILMFIISAYNYLIFPEKINFESSEAIYTFFIVNYPWLSHPIVKVLMSVILFLIDLKFFLNIHEIFTLFYEKKAEPKPLIRLGNQTALLLVLSGTVILNQGGIGLFNSTTLFNALLIWTVVKIFELHTRGVRL